MNLFQLATRGVDLSKLPDEEAPRQSVTFEPSTNGGKFSVPTDLNDAFEFAAKDFGIDPDVLRAVAYAESRFHPDVVSGKVKSKTGATGLMQFMPKTAQEYGIDPLDPVQSIFGAAAYLRKSLDKFDGDYGKAVASYNAGPNRKDFDAEDWDARMPAETQGYLRTVFTAADQLKQGGAATAKPTQAATNVPDTGDETARLAARYKAPREAVPNMTAGSVAQDALASVLAVGPTALKGVGELASMATGGRVGQEFAKDMQGRIDTVTGMVGSERGAAQKRNFQRDMADDSVSISDALLNNKGAMLDMALPSMGSMLLPVGAAGAATKLATLGKVAQGLDKAALAARVASAQQAAGIGATVAQNAASTFAELVDKGANLGDAYIAAGITVPFSLIAGKLTGGGAEGALIKGMGGKVGAAEAIKRGAVEVPKAMIREGGQEVGEEAGQITGEAVGTGKAPTLQGAAKQLAVAGTMGGLVGGGMNLAQQALERSAPTVESQPTTPTAPQVTPSNGVYPKPVNGVYPKPVNGVYPKPVNGVYPNSTATQAVDNIAALLKQTEANIDGTATQATPVQPGSQATDSGAAPVAQGPANSGGGLAAAGEAAATGQSESAQSLSQIRQKQEQVRAAMQGAVSPLPADIDTVRLKQEFARMHATAKGGFDPMADVNLQTGANTTGEDVKRLVTQARQAVDAKETAEIQRMLAEDAAAKQEMADAARTTADGVRSDSDRETQQSAVEGLAQRARTRLVDSLVASYAEPTGYFASPLLKEVASQLGVLQQPALSKQEQSRITELVTRAQVFVAPNLPADKASTPTDIGADNASMESLIKERQPKPAATGIAAEMAALKARANKPRQNKAPKPLLTDGERDMLADFERMYQSDVKGEIKTRLGLIPARQDEATAPTEKRKPSELLAAIKRAGGIKSTNAADLMGGSAMDANRILPGLFTNGGMNMDLLVPFLKERGYLTQADEDSIKDNGGVNKLAEILQAELSGARAQTMDSTAGFESNAEAAMRSELDSKAFALGLPMKVTNEMSTERLNGVINRIERKLGKPVNTDFATRKMSRTEAMAERQAILMADRVERARAQYDADIQAFAEANDRVQERVLDVMTDEDGNIEVIYESTAGEAYDEGRDTREDSGEVGRPVAQGARAGAGNPEANRTEAGAGQEGLTSYTPAEVTTRQNAAKEAEATAKRAEDAAARAEAAAKQASEIAQRSVAAADTFELGGNAEDNLSGQQGLRLSRASENRAARAALARIMEKGVTSPDDLHALLRVTGYSKWAKSTITGDVAGVAALRDRLTKEYPGTDWQAPKLNNQGIITLYADWADLTSDSIADLARIADEFDAPIAVRNGAVNNYYESKILRANGFEGYMGAQERMGRPSAVMFSHIRPAGGITATTPLFSQSQQSPRTPAAATNGITTEAAQKIVDGITAQWKNAPEVVVLADLQDVKAPKAVRDYDAQQRSQGAEGEPEGFWYKGKAYVVAGALNKPDDVARVLMHEALGHYGLRGVFGDDLKPILRQVAMMRQKDVAAKAEQYGLDVTDEAGRLHAAEEVLAEMAQSNPDAGVVKRAIAAIRAWMRKHIPGFKNMALTDSDIISNYLLPARNFVVDGGRDGDQDGGVRFQRSESAAQQNLALNDPSPAWMLPKSTKSDALVYELQDQKVDLKRTQEAIAEAGRTITEPFDARMAETLMPGRVAYRTETFLKTEVAPLMEAMAKNNVTQNELSDYLLARHAPERNAQIANVNPEMPDGGAGTNSQGVLMTTQAAQDHIAALTTGKRMVLQLLANKIDAITASTRDLLVREGLEKQSTMDAWTGAYKHYVPLFKDEAVESPAHPIGSGMSVTGSASKRATGSEGEVTNMVAHILMQREAAITRAEKNRVAMSLYGLALSNPNKDVWSTIRPSMSADKIGAELAAMGVDPVEAEQGMQGVPTIRTINAVTGLVQETPNPMYKRLDNALVVKVDGEDRVILFNAKNADAMRMARALKNQDGITKIDYSTGVISQALGFLSEVAGASTKTTNKIVEKTKGLNAANATRYLASINTQYNPAFGMVNVVRDIGGALVNLTTTGIADKKAQVFGDIHAAMKGIARDVRGDQARTPWSDLWVQFQEDGGRTGYRDLFIDPFKRAEAVQKDLDALQRDSKASAGKAAHLILDLLDDFNTTLENGVRLSAYKAALDKGMSRPAAAKMARELTVDFNRKGRMGREIGPLYAFFNASVQGTARTIESLKGPAGKKIIAGGLMLGVIQSLMLAAAGFDDDEPPEFVKARAFIIPMGDKRYIAIPLQFGLNALPNTGRVITDLLLTGGKDAGKKTFNAIGEIMGSFNPLGGGNIFTAHGLLTTVAPTVADPLVDLATNTNFAGTPIGKDRADWDTRPGAKLARESTQRSLTGQAYIGISKAINAASGGNEFKKGLASPTPEQVQYVFTTAGGGLYRELEKTLNIAGLKADGFEIKPRMIPLGGRFAGEADDQDTQRSRYYRNSERLAALEAELKGFEKDDNEAAVKRIESERSDEVDLLGDYKHIRQAITKLNKLAADNINDVEMLKELDAERLELMRELNDSVRKLEKRSELFKRD